MNEKIEGGATRRKKKGRGLIEMKDGKVRRAIKKVMVDDAKEARVRERRMMVVFNVANQATLL